MQFSFDTLGYPRLAVPYPGKPKKTWFWLAMYPITKLQYERFLTEPNDFEDSWYEDILAVNPRKSISASDGDREKFFLTGIYPKELTEFVKWMRLTDPACDIPTVDEWRGAYRALQKAPFSQSMLSELCEEYPIIKQLHNAFFREDPPSTWLEATLMIEGVMEWVKDNDSGSIGYCLGRLRPGFHGSVSDPLNDRPRRPNELIKAKRTHLRYVGSRMIYRV